MTCHCDAVFSAEAISKCEIPRGVYPERKDEILRFAQNDMRRAQNDKERRTRNDGAGVFSIKSNIFLLSYFFNNHYYHGV